MKNSQNAVKSKEITTAILDRKTKVVKEGWIETRARDN
jgi:hypothetical protein